MWFDSVQKLTKAESRNHFWSINASIKELAAHFFLSERPQRKTQIPIKQEKLYSSVSSIDDWLLIIGVCVQRCLLRSCSSQRTWRSWQEKRWRSSASSLELHPSAAPGWSSGSRWVSLSHIQLLVDQFSRQPPGWECLLCVCWSDPGMLLRHLHRELRQQQQADHQQRAAGALRLLHRGAEEQLRPPTGGPQPHHRWWEHL